MNRDGPLGTQGDIGETDKKGASRRAKIGIESWTNFLKRCRLKDIKAGYKATLVACGWVGAVIEKLTGAFGQKLWAQNT